MLQKNGRFIILLTFIVLFPFKSEAGTPQLIDISTKKTSMIFHITSDGEVLFQYYGSRINDQLPFFDKKKLVNKLFLDATDPASREPEYKICAARIKKA